MWFVPCNCIQPSAPLCFNTFDWSFSHTVAPIKPRVWAGLCIGIIHQHTLFSHQEKMSPALITISLFTEGFSQCVRNLCTLFPRTLSKKDIDIGDKTDANYAIFFKWGAVKCRKRNEASIFWWFLKYKWERIVNALLGYRWVSCRHWTRRCAVCSELEPVQFCKINSKTAY